MSLFNDYTILYKKSIALLPCRYQTVQMFVLSPYCSSPRKALIFSKCMRRQTQDHVPIEDIYSLIMHQTQA